MKTRREENEKKGRGKKIRIYKGNVGVERNCKKGVSKNDDKESENKGTVKLNVERKG